MYLRKLFSILVICYPALVQSQTSAVPPISSTAQSDVVVVSKSTPEPAKKYNATPTTVHIKPLGVVEVKNMKILNGSKDDFSPMYYEDGLLYCSNSRKVKKGTDPDKIPDDMNLKYALFDSTRQLIKPTSFGKRTNSKTHEGPVCFTRNGDTMFLTRNMSKGGIDKKSKNGLYTLKIYLKTRDSLGNFLGDKLLPFELENYSYCHPTVTPDGKRLIFSSNIPGGFGGMDLYMIRKINDSTWTAPINLGARVNTAKNEVFPHFSEKGILYFASNGQPKGKGGLDIFGIELDKRNGAATSLGEPFNTIEDDFGLIFLPNNPKKGFFSSNRIGGLGGDDIYEFEEKDE